MKYSRPNILHRQTSWMLFGVKRYLVLSSRVKLFCFYHPVKCCWFYKHWSVFSVDSFKKKRNKMFDSINILHHSTNGWRKKVPMAQEKGTKMYQFTMILSEEKRSFKFICVVSYNLYGRQRCHLKWKDWLKNKSIQIGELLARHRPSICPLFTLEQTGPLTSFEKTTKYISKQANT